MAIEAEARSFITKEQYEKLLDFFKQNAKLLKEDYQETFYLNCEQDLRIQRNNFYSKVWLKKGKMHDDSREEIEIKFDKTQFEELEQLFLALGLQVQIKWFRKRFEFLWEDITLDLDYTKGYGYIIELKKMSSEESKEKDFERLKQKLLSLGITPSSKEEFDKKYQDYKLNWKELTKD